MWSSTSLAPVEHASDTPSISDINIGKKNRTVKFSCMLCKGDHYSHLFSRMDKASYILEKIRLPYCYHDNISPKISLVDGLVNIVPSLISLVDHVVNLVSSLVEPLTQVVDPVPSSISPNLHLKSENQAIDPVMSSINPTLNLKSVKVVDPVASSIDPSPLLKNETKVVDPVPSLVDPTPHSKSEDVTRVYFINTDSPRQGGTLPILMAPPSSKSNDFY
jgi:hypothetical protein